MIVLCVTVCTASPLVHLLAGIAYCGRNAATLWVSGSAILTFVVQTIQQWTNCMVSMDRRHDSNCGYNRWKVLTVSLMCHTCAIGDTMASTFRARSRSCHLGVQS